MAAMTWRQWIRTVEIVPAARGTAIFEREDLPRAYRRMVQALA
jgi:hypothetical protein